jgi:hypothetical protein
MSHDQRFKNLICDYPLQALQFFAAEEAEALDANVRILPVREEQLQERLGERFRELDVPLLVEWPDGRREALLFALEEDTEGRRFSIHRLAHYCLDLSELFETERVVPVVIFLRDGQRPAQLSLGGDRHRYLHFHYLACSLYDLDWQAYRDSDNLVARLNLPNMRHQRNERVAVFAAAVRGLVALEPDPERQLKYVDFVDIYANLSDAERDQYQRDYPEETKAMVSFQSRFEQRGIERGIQRGEAAVLLNLLQAKFGPLSESIRERIEQADAETLLAWSTRILTEDSVEGVLRSAPTDS